MAETAENLAERYKLDRGMRRRVRAEVAAAVEGCVGRGRVRRRSRPDPDSESEDAARPRSSRRDEHMRPDTTAEELGALKPVFRKDGVVTAGNASGIGDGAAAMVIASEQFAR